MFLFSIPFTKACLYIGIDQQFEADLLMSSEDVLPHQVTPNSQEWVLLHASAYLMREEWMIIPFRIASVVNR